jgi:hypothetical protein
VEPIITKVRKDTKESINYILKFCQNKNIKNSLRSFLFYKKEGASIPESIYFFFGQTYSKYYFFNSKIFYEYYNSLPPDFKKDIAPFEEISQFQRLTVAYPDVQEFISSLLQKDYVYWSEKNVL